MMGYRLKVYFVALVASSAMDEMRLDRVARTFYRNNLGVLIAKSTQV